MMKKNYPIEMGCCKYNFFKEIHNGATEFI